MVLLNDPPDWEEYLAKEKEWTPAIGMRRAALWGGLTAAILAAIAGFVAYEAPPLAAGSLYRGACGFATMWIIIGIAQRSAGMVGWPLTGLAAGLSLVVFLVDIAVLVSCPLGQFSLISLAHVWAQPFGTALLIMPTLIGMIGAGAMCHGGNATINDVVDIVMRNPFYWSR